MRALVEHALIQSFWRDAKRWKRISLGPVYFTFKFARRYQDRLVRPFLLWLAPTEGDSVGNQRTTLESRRPGESVVSTTRVAAVVGVGPGLGEALALLLAQGGFRVALVSRSKLALEELAAHL